MSPSFDERPRECVAVRVCVPLEFMLFRPSSLPSFTGYSRKIQITVFQSVVGPCGSEFVLNLPLLLCPSASASVHYLSPSAPLT